MAYFTTEAGVQQVSKWPRVMVLFRTFSNKCKAKRGPGT